MGLGRLAGKLIKKLPAAAMKASPVGRVASIASVAKGLASGVKRVAKAGLAASPGLMAAASQALGIRRKRRKSGFGISDKEAMELMKLKMFISPRSIPYQMAVMKAMNRRVK